MARKRNGRQEAIREIVRAGGVRTQRTLVEELRDRGFDCTQATVSRDIADMGLRKVPEGIYALPEDLYLKRMVTDMVIEIVRTEKLVLIKAQPGMASGIAGPASSRSLSSCLPSPWGFSERKTYRRRSALVKAT